MGCDIHLYKEKRVDGLWQTADEWLLDEDCRYPREQFDDRNYNLFGILAKVRRSYECSFVPRGLPVNVSRDVVEASEGWGADGHSHSHLYLHELRDLQALIKVSSLPVSGMKHRDELAELRASIATGEPDWRLLYPYCQGTNSPDYEAFELQLPMSEVIGDAVDRIVASFDGVDGDNHRIVFWFDN